MAGLDIIAFAEVPACGR